MNEEQVNKVIDGREMVAEAKAEAAADEHAASEERVATPGWPIRLADGSEVMAVSKKVTPNGTTVLDADGNEYAPRVQGLGTYEQVENEALADRMLSGGSADPDETGDDE